MLAEDERLACGSGCEIWDLGFGIFASRDLGLRHRLPFCRPIKFVSIPAFFNCASSQRFVVRGRKRPTRIEVSVGCRAHDQPGLRTAPSEQVADLIMEARGDAGRHGDRTFRPF